jgi:acetylornithine deacetylase/succinyl-diaminopimelate desuccinylase-like protein
VQVDVEVTCLDRPVHSGDFGGAVPDAVRILCGLIDGLRARDGRIDVPGLYRDVARPSASVRRRLARLPFSEAAFRRAAAMLPGTRLARERGVSALEQLWLRPSLSVTGIEAHPLHGSANQILDSARARLSLHTVPRMDPEDAGRKLIGALESRAPAGARVEARIFGKPSWGASRIDDAALEAATRALDEKIGTLGRLRKGTASGRKRPRGGGR